MSRSYYTLLYLLLLLGMLGAAYGMDPWLVRTCVPFLLLPCGVALVLGYRKWRRQIRLRRSRSGPRRLTLAMLAAIVTLLLSVALNYGVSQQAEGEAKAYPAKAASLLEQYRGTHGSYPPSLVDLPSVPSPPRLMRRTYSYGTDGKTYWFRFPVPGILTEQWVYRSTSHEWSRDVTPPSELAEGGGWSWLSDE